MTDNQKRALYVRQLRRHGAFFSAMPGKAVGGLPANPGTGANDRPKMQAPTLYASAVTISPALYADPAASTGNMWADTETPTPTRRTRAANYADAGIRSAQSALAARAAEVNAARLARLWANMRKCSWCGGPNTRPVELTCSAECHDRHTAYAVANLD